MLACLDVHYDEEFACAAAIVFGDWHLETPILKYTKLVKNRNEYEPGRFYLRELAPLMAVIETIAEPIGTFIIDGYCYLSSDRTPGLGVYLYQAMDQQVSVIGVAKNRFKKSTHAEKVFRGGSRRPLFVTSMGLSQKQAASKIASMAGSNRIPKLLKAVDQLARSGFPEFCIGTRKKCKSTAFALLQ